MRLIGLTLFAALVVGCTSPTSPSALGTTQPTIGADTQLGAEGASTTQRVTLYVVEDDDGYTQQKNVVVGLTVSLTSEPVETFHAETVTNSQGAAIFWIPRTITEIRVTTGECGTHHGETETFVQSTIDLNLPVNTREGWIRIHETDPNGSCTLP